MLCVTVKEDEALHIGAATIYVKRNPNGTYKVAIDAPAEVHVVMEAAKRKEAGDDVTE